MRKSGGMRSCGLSWQTAHLSLYNSAPSGEVAGACCCGPVWEEAAILPKERKVAGKEIAEIKTPEIKTTANIVTGVFIQLLIAIRFYRSESGDGIERRPRAADHRDRRSSQQKFPAVALGAGFAQRFQVAVVEDVHAHRHQSQLVNRMRHPFDSRTHH